MFGVSLPELLVVLIVCLMVFGPDRLPEIARKLGKLSAELKKTSDSVRREFYNSVYTPVQQELDTSNRQLKSFKEDLKISNLFEPDPNCPDHPNNQKKIEETKPEESKEKTPA